MKIASEQEMKNLGRAIGQALNGGEILELVGDVGAGKTTLTKGLAEGLEISEPVQSPTFTISRIYQSPGGLKLAHYDFYRLSEAGIMGDEISEAVADQDSVIVIEWAGAIDGQLPKDRLIVKIAATEDDQRLVEMLAGGEISKKLLHKTRERLDDYFA